MTRHPSPFVLSHAGAMPAPQDVTKGQMEAAVKNFLKGFAENSRVTIKYCLRRVADDLGMPAGRVEILPWHTLNSETFQDLIDLWGNEGLAKGTIRLYMHAVRGLSRSLFIRNLISNNDYLLLREVKLPRGINKVGRGRAIERKYRDMLIADCMNDERIQGVRDAALIAILFGSGMRRAEIVGIQTEGIDLSEGEVVVRVKGGNTVTKYIAAWSIQYIKEWQRVLKSRTDQYKGPLFPAISKGGKCADKPITGRGLFYILEERSKRAGLPFLVRPHDARRTMGTQMLTDHGDLVAQRVLGHANLSTTAIYDKRSDDLIKGIMRKTS